MHLKYSPVFSKIKLWQRLKLFIFILKDMLNKHISSCKMLTKLAFINYSTAGSGADAIKKFTPSLGIPYLGV
jgi:hypothetical protein